MALDREATLRNAEKFLRVGRLDAAIAEYARVLDEQPRDWSTANTLGDLYLRAGQSERAVALYQKIADHLLSEGFYPRAAALLKKILKITPDDEVALVHLGEISTRQGLLAEARGYFTSVANRRQQRGDSAGADEMVVRLGSLDPADLDARLNGARARDRRGDVAGAAAEFRELYDEFLAKGRDDAAAAVLQDFLRCQPDASDAALFVAILAADLRAARFDAARGRLPQLVATTDGREAVTHLAWDLMSSHRDAAELCLGFVVDTAVAAGEFAEAAALLQELSARVPGHIHALLRLVEVSVDGGLEASMYDAQARLADAYLAAGRASEARVIAEDLVAHAPADPSHIARLRRALEMLEVPNIEGVIADRVSGSQSEAGESHEEPPGAAPGKAIEMPFSEGEEAQASAAIEAMPSLPASFVPETIDHSPDAPPDADAPLTMSAMEIDLTVALADLQQGVTVPSAAAPPQPDLEDVFAEIRIDVNRAQDGEDARGYLDLARTYIEMAMPDEAEGAAVIAAKSPAHRFEAACLLAHLFRDRGDIPGAIDWYERAVESPATSAEAAREVLYDLGDLFETMGEGDRALAIFMELATDAPGYRDVEARVSRLSKSGTGG